MICSVSGDMVYLGDVLVPLDPIEFEAVGVVRGCTLRQHEKSRRNRDFLIF